MLTEAAFDAFMTNFIEEDLRIGYWGFFEDETWPEMYCQDTCTAIMDAFREVFGRGWQMRSGGYRTKGDNEEGHAWLEHRDGTIADPTAGQFRPRTKLWSAWAVVKPGTSEHKRYTD